MRSPIWLRPISRPMRVPHTMAITRPSATDSKVMPVARRNAALASTCGMAATMPDGVATYEGAKPRTTPSHSSRMTAPATSRGTVAPAGRRRRRADVAGTAMLVIRSVPPGREAALKRLSDPHEPEARRDDDQDGREHCGGVEILRRRHDDLTEAGCAQKELRRHHADEGAPGRLPESGHHEWQRVGNHHLAPQRPFARTVG